MPLLHEELNLEFDRERRMTFWDSMRDWFVERGYTPYTRDYENGLPESYTYPTSLGCPTQDAKFPYAFPEDECIPNLFFLDDWRGLVVCAQDSRGRHVAMKLVKDGSQEYRVLRFLYEYTRDRPPSFNAFNHVIPVLDLLQLDDYWLGVMPRWGTHPTLPAFETVRDILTLIHDLLKGLNFLHSNKIAHGDISTGNVLVNHLGADGNFDLLPRRHFRSRGVLTYALFDFGFSTMFPPDAKPEQCRLPYQMSWRGTPFFVPDDTLQGEFDFDPFAWDVAALGITICNHFQYITSNVPMLAPLLDKMVTWDIPQRFTAAEALRFFEQMYEELTEEELSAKPADVDKTASYDSYDRWKKLDPTFVTRWSHYKIPPRPWTVNFMRFVCRYEWSFHVVPWIRWIFASMGGKISRGFKFTSKAAFNRSSS